MNRHTFKAFLENVDFIKEVGIDRKFNSWIDTFLSNNNQSITQEVNSDTEKKSNRENDVQALAEWIIGLLPKYINNTEVLSLLFSSSIVDYIKRRLIGDIKGFPIVNLGEDSDFGLVIENCISTISQFIKDGGICLDFWSLIHSIFTHSSILYEYQLAKKHILMLDHNIPQDDRGQLASALLYGIQKNLNNVSDDTKEAWLQEELRFILSFARQLDSDKLEMYGMEISENFTKILQQVDFHESLIKLVEDSSIVQEKSNLRPFLASIIDSLNLLNIDLSHHTTILKIIIDNDQIVDDVMRNSLINSINKFIKTNTAISIETSIIYITAIGSNKKYYSILSTNVDKWLSYLSDAPIPILEQKLTLFLKLTELGLLHFSNFLEKMKELFPFSGDKEKLKLICEKLESNHDLISQKEGSILFNLVIANIDSYREYKILALTLISKWFESSKEEERIVFLNQLYKITPSSPVWSLKTISPLWKLIKSDDKKRFLILFYSTDLDPDSAELLKDITLNHIKSIPIDAKSDFVFSVWVILNDSKKNSQQFLNVASRNLDITQIYTIRNTSIQQIRSNITSTDISKHFTFLAESLFLDIREIMPVINLFEFLFIGDENRVSLALKYFDSVLVPMDLRRDHKKKIAKAMGKASVNSSAELKEKILEKAIAMRFDWVPYRQYFNEFNNR